MPQARPRQRRSRLPFTLHGRGPHRAARVTSDELQLRFGARGGRPRQPPGEPP